MLKFIYLLSLWACGNENGSNYQATDDDLLVHDKPIVFEGYVQNAFEITVNDKEYEDIEDFYTKQYQLLPAMIKELGYENHTPKLEAEVGIDDLWLSMTVFLSAREKRGYMGKGSIDEDGNFKIELPPEALDEVYKLRANKRIGLSITNKADSEDITKICYNFSAINKSVEFSEHEKPIILDSFETRLTEYDCHAETIKKLDIPTKDGNTTETTEKATEKPTKLRRGLTKQQALDITTDIDFHVQTGFGDQTYFCYHNDNEKPFQCESENKIAMSECRCYLVFGGDNLLIDQSNIATNLIDVVSW